MKIFSIGLLTLAVVIGSLLAGCTESGDRNQAAAEQHNLGTETGEQPSGGNAATGPKMMAPE
ncbi:MAG: hypothetical protein ACK4XJ_02565 [Fimbriimonadaceae bacterium]